MTRRQPRPVTTAQVGYIKTLVESRDITSTPVLTAVESARASVMAGTFTTTMASALIDLLKKQPRLEDTSTDVPAPAILPGYYVRDGVALKVQQNKAKTGVYALRWTGERWEYAPGEARTLAGLSPMTAEQAAAIGLASGRCINCCATLGGSTLTAKVAALVGYGEICASNNGWAFPKGAKAQRAFLASKSPVAA